MIGLYCFLSEYVIYYVKYYIVIITEVFMKVSFKPLFKMLIDKGMKKKDLSKLSGVSIATITKMGREGVNVSSDVLARLATALHCKIDDIIEIVKDKITSKPTE